MVPWYWTLWRITWWVFSRVWPPLMAVGWPLLAIYGAFEPRSGDLAALKLHHGEFAVLVGIGGGGRTCGNREPCVVAPGERSYLVIPRSLLDGSGYAVRDTEPRQTVQREPGAAVLIAVIWVLCASSTWHYWIRKPSGHLTIVGGDRER
jgi:hypothetical protein